MADWSQLPNELLEIIATRLNSSIHTIQLRAVCSAWRAAVSPCSRYLTSSVIFGDGYIVSKRTIFLLSRPTKPMSYSSALGNTEPDNASGPSWLIKAAQNDMSRSCSLFNPLSEAEISPSSPRMIDLMSTRVRELGAEYVFDHPNSSMRVWTDKVSYLQENDRDYFLLLIISGKLLLICRNSSSGEEEWSEWIDNKSVYHDQMVFDGVFYAVDYTGRAISIKCAGFPNVVVTEVAKSIVYGNGHANKKQLVRVGEDVMMVDRYICSPSEVCCFEIQDSENNNLTGNETLIRFKAYKLNKSKCDWAEVESLGDNVLFLGDNSSFSASASDLLYSKGNCIFFHFENWFLSNISRSIDEVD